jgi:hypothetical protein
MEIYILVENMSVTNLNIFPLIMSLVPYRNNALKMRQMNLADRKLSKTKNVVQMSSNHKKQKQKHNDDFDSFQWTYDHEMIGVNVAKYFGNRWHRKLFAGVVEKFGLPSLRGGLDYVYHIVFEDGDEEDWDESELRFGAALHAGYHATSI